MLLCRLLLEMVLMVMLLRFVGGLIVLLLIRCFRVRGAGGRVCGVDGVVCVVIGRHVVVG